MEQTINKKRSFKKLVLAIIGTLLALVIIAVVGFAVLFRHELITLSSIESANGKDFFTMKYSGDYGFDKFLETGASNDGELIEFVTKQILKGIPLEFSIPDLGCSTFAAQSPEGENLFGRNFDLSYSPALFVETTPKNGYKSISMVNLGFLGYNENKLPTTLTKKIISLAAPYAPLDGVNEKGVAIGVLLIATDATNQQTDKIDITTTTAIRLVLDKAASVDEAVALLESYDMHSSAGTSYHFQIADKSGKSVIVEYLDNEFSVIDGNCATNFLLTPGEYYNFGKGQNRYEILDSTLKENNGILSAESSMDLLESVSQKSTEDNPKKSTTQWSVVYNLETGSAEISTSMDYDNIYKYAIK